MFWLFAFIVYVVGLVLFFIASYIAEWDVIEEHDGYSDSRFKEVALMLWKTFGIISVGWFVGYLMAVLFVLSMISAGICALFQF